MPEVVHFRFENPPEALHRAVVDAAAGPGHTLRCMDTVQLCFELPVGVLIAPVAVKQRMGAGVGSHRSVKGVKNKLIVVGSAQRIRNDAFIMEIKDRAQVRFLPVVKFEFCDICQPFLIGTICRKFSVQYVFSGNKRFRHDIVLLLSAYHGLHVHAFHQAVNPLVVVVPFEPAVHIQRHTAITVDAFYFAVQTDDFFQQEGIFFF